MVGKGKAKKNKVSAPIAITVFTKSGGPLTKRISLTQSGAIFSDGSACTMASGQAARTSITDIADFAALIESLESNQAITLGALRDDLPDACEVTTKDKLDGQTRPDLIARTAEALVYRPGQPAFILLDNDAKGQPPDVAARVAALGGFWDALVTVLPALGAAMHVIRPSTSAGLVRTDTGERFPGSGGVHGYIIADDGTDAVRFLETLHKRCWLHGLGWWMIDVAGRLLERSIVDRMVGQPERLVFEGAPVVVPPLTQNQASRRAQVTMGGTVDTITACRPLAAHEQAELDKLMAAAAQPLQPECAKVRATFIQAHAARLATRTGCTMEEAARVIARQCAGVLLPAVELPFDDSSLSGKTVADVLADPAAFEGCTLADPIEGIGYGRTKAMIMRRKDGTVFINSFAHGGMQYELRDDSGLPAALQKKLGAPDGAGNFYSFIRAALNQAIADDLIVEACCDRSYGGAIYEHVAAGGGADYIKRQIAAAANEPPTDHKGRTVIVVQKGKTDEIWRETQQALIAHGCPVYQRGNRLVQPLWHWEKDGKRNVLVTRFETLNATRLRDIVAHHAVRFQKYNNRTRKMEDIDPPSRVMTDLIEIKHWLLSTTVGIINAPTLREDGSLLTQQGYDPQTQLWFKASDDIHLPPIPEHPTEDEAKAALETLNELLAEFPFEGEPKEKTKAQKKSVARSVALAGMMTTVLRGALPVAVPIFLMNATEPRTGKTYLVHLIAMLATGHIPPSTAGASEDRPDELEKRVETGALSGRPILHFNNLPNGMVVQSERLAELSTEGTCNIRKLGKHEEGLCDCRATTVFLNGNNVRVAGDLVPRTLLCRLNVASEEPETRTFNSDPMAQVRGNRGAYLAAIFTIVRAFIHAGCPKPEGMHSVAGFEAWSRLVQQPLMWLGMADPFGNITSMREMDPTLDELSNLLNVLRDNFKAGDIFTVAECHKRAEEWGGPNRQALRDLMIVDGKINTKSFGRLLARFLQRVKDGWYYEPAGKVNNSAAYKLVKKENQP